MGIKRIDETSTLIVKMNDIGEQARQYVVKLTSKQAFDGQLACDLPSRHDRSWGILRGFVLVLLHHECPKNAVFDLLKQYHPILLRLNESDFFRVTKFLCAYPQARYLRNETPSCDLLPTFPMSGNFRRWLRTRMNKYSRVNTHLFMSWFQVKRSALPASPALVDENLLSHRRNMIAPDRASPRYVGECLRAADSVLQRICNKIEPDFNRFIDAKASQSASFVSTRLTGGQAGELTRRLGDVFLDDTPNWTADEWLEPAIAPGGYPNLITRRNLDFKANTIKIVTNGPDIDGIPDVSIVRIRDGEEIFDERLYVDDFPRDLLSMDAKLSRFDYTVDFATRSVFTDAYFRELFRRRMTPRTDENFYDPEILEVDDVPYLRARVAVVLEPLKVRTVTAGPAAHYFIARMYQNAAHSYMRNMPCFRLIGRPASPTDIMSIQVFNEQEVEEWNEELPQAFDNQDSPYLGMRKYYESKLEWYSADYKESTDRLSRYLSSNILQQTLSSDWLDWRRILLFNLKPHIVCYPANVILRREITELEYARYKWFCRELSNAFHKHDLARHQQICKDIERFRRAIDIPMDDRRKELLRENQELWDEGELSKFIDEADLATILKPDSHSDIHLTSLVNTTFSHEEYVRAADEKGREIRVGGKYYLTLRRALPPVIQNNAQLMGSRLSFVILCLSNLSLYLAVRKRTDDSLGIEWNRKRVRFWLDRVLINGDDLLTQFNETEINWFNEIGNDIGLVMSVGKTYRHSRYANINSTAYDCPIIGGHAYEIPYLNSGLFFGQNKVIARVGGIDELNEQERVNGEAPCIAVLDEVVAGSLPGKKVELLSAYIEFHKSELQKQARGRNLFIALSLGGWGCRPPVGWTYHVTPSQLNEVARLYRSTDVPLVRPFVGRQVDEHEDQDLRSWRYVLSVNSERPRLRPLRGDLPPSPHVDLEIERVQRGSFVVRL